MEVYLIRHAESEDCVFDPSTRTDVADYNALVRRIPETNLTTKGEQQAAELCERLKHISVQQLYASPFPRALATANILGQTLKLSPQIMEEAYEVTPIELRWHTLALPLSWHFRLAYARMLWPWGSQPSWWWHYRRARRVWNQLSHEEAESIVLVAHGWLIAMIVLSLTGSRHWRVATWNLANCGISLIERRH